MSYFYCFALQVSFLATTLLVMGEIKVYNFAEFAKTCIFDTLHYAEIANFMEFFWSFGSFGFQISFLIPNRFTSVELKCFHYF